MKTVLNIDYHHHYLAGQYVFIIRKKIQKFKLTRQYPKVENDQLV